uniref:Uncharacterized protein n=1 Tax=Magallana gigas TaxID=29159 RepID=K1PCS5_MAGGI
MEYRGDGIRLDIKTAKLNLTSLQNSPQWMPIKVNLDNSEDGYQNVETLQKEKHTSGKSHAQSMGVNA